MPVTSQANLNLTCIEDKKIICQETNQEIQLSDLWNNLQKDQFVVIVLFRRFGCIFCKNSAIEMSKIASKIEKRFPNKVKFIGIGVDDNNIEEWKKEKYFKYPLYINKKRTIYKALKMKRPNCLNGYGFCQKKVSKTLNKISINDKTKDLKTNAGGGDMFQLGGSMIINSQGNIEFVYFDSYYGDHASEEDILRVFNDIVDE